MNAIKIALPLAFCSVVIHSGAPTGASRALDGAPYSWKMVNLFSFGCHVIDRERPRVQDFLTSK